MTTQFMVYGIVVLICIAKIFISYYIQKSNLGEETLVIDKETTQTKLIKQIALFVVSVVIGIYYIYNYSIDNPSVFQLLPVVLLGAFAGSTLTPVLMSFTPIGVYENGILSLTGIRLFNRTGSYEFNPVKDKNVAMACFYPRKKFLGKVSYLYISNQNKKKLEKLVKPKII